VLRTQPPQHHMAEDYESLTFFEVRRSEWTFCVNVTLIQEHFFNDGSAKAYYRDEWDCRDFTTAFCLLHESQEMIGFYGVDLCKWAWWYNELSVDPDVTHDLLSRVRECVSKEQSGVYCSLGQRAAPLQYSIEFMNLVKHYLLPGALTLMESSHKRIRADWIMAVVRAGRNF